MNKIIINLIKRYQKNTSPKLYDRGVRCIFNPSCSQHGINVLEKYNIFIALPIIIYRILSCNPINAHYKSKKLLINK